jgi:serine protease Do
MPAAHHYLLGAAAALIALPLALTGCTTIVATPVADPTTKPTADPIDIAKPTNEPAPPDGEFTTVFDDSGIVSVNVPTSWVDLQGGELTNSDGVIFKNVTAATNINEWSSGWTAPGVAVSATQDPNIVIADIIAGTTDGAGAECDPPETGDYDDGLYVGTYAYFENCGGLTTDYVTVVAQDINQTHFIICSIQMVSDEDKSTIRDEILTSFRADF